LANAHNVMVKSCKINSFSFATAAYDSTASKGSWHQASGASAHAMFDKLWGSAW